MAAIITLAEIFDLVVMTFFVGFVFSGIMPVKRENYDPLVHYKRRFDYESFILTTLATAPGIILHELAHKFVALGFGLNAVFYAFYRSTFTLVLGAMAVLSKLTGIGFMFFVPGFVGIGGNGTNLQYALTSLAGPLVNLLFWIVPWLLLKKKMAGRKYQPLLMLTSRINMYLFIFNMLPIPGFDGFKFYIDIIRAFIG